jgi:hypothetical protein
VGLEIGCGDHHGLCLTVVRRQAHHHLREDTFVTPPLPTIVECLVWAILFWRITPPKPIAIDEDYSAQYTTIINAGLPWDFGKKGLRRAICASFNQKRSDMSPLSFRTVNHADPSKSMGPEPKLTFSQVEMLRA